MTDYLNVKTLLQSSKKCVCMCCVCDRGARKYAVPKGT